MRSGSDLLGVLLDGRYRIDSTIAHGGMSTVYRGIDLRLDRPIAIKVMDPRFANDPAFLSRFELEARSVARLSHAGLVAVYDQGSDDGHVFLVMDLIEGGTLRDLLRERGALSVPVAFSVLEPVLAALATAHRAGLVHRDVKPENILVAHDGAVKIADFGLVRALAEAGVTAGSMILGTAAYLSPEQVSAGSSDARSDVYSAGVLLYEMLTGAPPYSGDTALAVAYQHVNTDTTAPSRHVPNLPPELDDLVLRATRRDPGARFRDAGEMLAEVQELRRWLHVVPVRVPTPHRPAEHRSPDAPTIAVNHTRAMATELFTPGSTQQPEQPPVESDFQAQRRRARRSVAVWIVVVLLLASAVGVGGWWLGSGRFTAVPRLTGLPRSTAEQLLSEAHLQGVQLDGYDDTAPPAQVLAAEPVAGSKVTRGSTVKLTVSLGRPIVPPIAAGTPASAVQQQLSAMTLQPKGTSGAYNDTVPEGTLLTLVPPAGTVVDVGTAVQVTLSLGPVPVPVPDVLGRTVADATAALDSVGLKVGATSEVSSRTVAGGSVAATDPQPGATARRGSPVTLQVSNALTVPELSGSAPEKAIADLTAAGFAPTTGAAVFDARVDAGAVAGTVPAAGTLVDPANPQVQVVVSTAVTVPNLRGQTVAAARSQLAARGLQTTVRQLVPYDGSVVIGQDAEPGTRVPPGSAVVITALP